MPPFDAAKAVDPLDYDFTTAGFKGKGRIPDPIDEEIEAFRVRLASIFEIDPDDLSKETMAAALDRLQQELQSATKEERKAAADDMYDELVTALATLCKNTPSVEEIKGLSRRYFSAFIGWLFTELFPKEEEPQTPTRPVLAVRRGAGS